MQTEPTVFVVDDDPDVRDAIQLLLHTVGRPVMTFESAPAFLDTYDATQPGCLVLDVRLKGMSGLELQTELHRQSITIPVIIITAHGDMPLAVRAMKAGALDCLAKPFNDQELLERIQQAIDLDARSREKLACTDKIAARLALLTPREREVLNGILEGKTSQVIANELDIAKKTIDAHRAAIMEKMEARSVAELVRLVIKLNNPAAPVA